VPTEAALARAEKRDFEPADVLLERILSERRRRWEEAELAKLKVAGKSPKGDKWKAKYEEPTSPDTKALPLLPGGWCWASVDQLGEVITGTTPASTNAGYYGDKGDGNVAFFKPTDLDAGENVFEARQYLTPEGQEQARRLPALSVLVTCIGATIGKVGLARVECTTNQQINAWMPADSLLSSRYGYWSFVSPVGRGQVIENASSTTLPILNKGRFLQIAVPLPPTAEQERIVADVERFLSIGDAGASVIAQLAQRIRRMRQAILKWAFEGKLVDQDPNDEPAEKLLERIRAERAHAETPKRTRRPRKDA
jgi:type I restriction enzyme S subunit